MRIVHVAPTPFGPHGLLGGGERYPLELARALAQAGIVHTHHMRSLPSRLAALAGRARGQRLASA